MLNITNSYGKEVVAEFDAQVFGRNAKVQAWRLKEDLHHGEGMQDFLKRLPYLPYFPMWTTRSLG